jgi:hypothetical protein
MSKIVFQVIVGVMGGPSYDLGMQLNFNKRGSLEREKKSL